MPSATLIEQSLESFLRFHRANGEDVDINGRRGNTGSPAGLWGAQSLKQTPGYQVINNLFI
jgi:hypothetical protein